jgi:hypothetical protein
METKTIKAIAVMSGIATGIGVYSLLRYTILNDVQGNNILPVLAGTIAIVVVHDELVRHLRK